MKARTTRKPENIDEYLATLDADKRAALERLRKIIRAAAPKAEECISYGIPAFRQDGLLVFFGASANHCSFYPGSAGMAALLEELEGFETSKGTIRFQPQKPLPAALVRKLVKARLAENQRRRGPKAGDKTGRAGAPETRERPDAGRDRHLQTRSPSGRTERRPR